MLDARELYDIFTVQIQMRDRLVGGTPRSKDMIRSWLEARTGHSDETTDEQEAEIAAAIDAAEDSCWTGFCGDERGLYLHTRNVKAMIKQCASVLGITKKKRGSKQILHEGAEVKAPDGGDKLYLERQEPDGSEERPIHVMTARGPRNALKRVDYVNGARLAFEVWVLKTAAQETRHIGEKELTKILTFAQENGLGADRSIGYGKFDVIEFGKV